MEKLVELDFAQIINDSEILILPENSSIEEALALENLSSPENQNNQDSATTQNDQQPGNSEDEDFEEIFQKSLDKRQSVMAPQIEDFSHLLPQSPSSNENKPDPDLGLQINRVLKARLLSFQKRLVNLLNMIDEQTKSNRRFLELSKSKMGKDACNFKSTYVKCGSPFFKDALSYPAPFNEDYKFRRDILKEFFPFDLPQNSSRWRTSEKAALINGVKTQMINYIKSHQSRKLCEDQRKTRGKLQKLKFISQSKDLVDSPILEIYLSIEKDFPDFKINWNLISFDDLQSTHSVSECMGMWYSYLRPDLNREPYSEEEEKILTNGVVAGLPWSEIVENLNSRSFLCTFVHFHSSYSKFVSCNVRWSDAENTKLLIAVDKNTINGVVNWTKVAQALPTRNKTQCYNRYQIILRTQDNKRGVFSREENRKILNFVARFGENAWSNLTQQQLPGRSVVQIRNHYNVALKHRGTVHPWTREEDKQLVEFVGQHGTNNWAAVANLLQTHSRISCRTRFITISKFLAKNPGKSVEDVPSKLKKVTAVKKAIEDTGDDDPEPAKPTLEDFRRKNPELFKMFKTAYNYSLSHQGHHVDDAKLKILIRLFNMTELDVDRKRHHFLTASQLQKLESLKKLTIPIEVASQINLATTIHSTQFLHPPNLNTAMGLRACTIKLSEEEDDTAEEVEVKDEITPEYLQAKEDFQKLYFTLFYWTAMLAKIDMDELNVIHFSQHDFGRKNMAPRDVSDGASRGNFCYSVSNQELKRGADEPGTSGEVKKRKL